MKLSKNFTLQELTRTSRESLQNVNIEQATNDLAVLQNLTDLAVKILQPIRDFYGKPVKVTSGYRSKALNIAVGGSQTSQHSHGEAADIQIEGISVDKLFEDLKSGKVVPLDNIGQVIKEKVGGAEWIHIGIMTPRYSEIQKAKYGSDEAIFLVTKDGKNYERIV